MGLVSLGSDIYVIIYAWNRKWQFKLQFRYGFKTAVSKLETTATLKTFHCTTSIYCSWGNSVKTLLKTPRVTTASHNCPEVQAQHIL